MPVYNAERYVGAALESVLGQDYPNVEVIAVNDGSTDRSAEVLAHYQERLTVLNQENGGQCVAANRAFEASSGELIKFFDADDIMSPDMISRQVSRLGARRDAVALGEWTRFYGNEPAHENFPSRRMYRDADPVDWLTQEWTVSQPMMQCALWLVPRRIVERAGLWDERLSLINDFEYFARILTNSSQILYSPGARLFYRSAVPNSLSGQKSRSAVVSQHLSLMLSTEHLLATSDSEVSRRACANMLQQFIYEHYPLHVDLRRSAAARIRELGGAKVDPIGPPNFHRLRRLVGWRAARQIQRAFETAISR